MKKGPLSNKEKEFIDDNKSMSNEDIAGKLERSVKVVSRYVEVRSLNSHIRTFCKKRRSWSHCHD